MSRQAKGPRLYLRAGRVHARTGRPVPDIFYIRDGTVEVSTGVGADRPAEAEAALGAYIVAKHAKAGTAAQGSAASRSDPGVVLVDEVIALYAEEKAPKVADPGSAGARLSALLAYWTGKTLSDVKRSECTAYVAHRMTQPVGTYKDPTKARLVSAQGARRELEDLSAAIGYWDDEHHLTRRPKVALPEKPESPRDALTRDQAARLLRAARGWRWNPKIAAWQRLRDSGPSNRRHMVRFILMGLYTGTRPGVLPKVLWVESLHQAWVDLDEEIIYRRGKSEKDHRTKRRPLVRLPARLLRHMVHWRRQDIAAAQRASEVAAKRGEEPVAAPSTVIHHGGQPIAGRVRRSFKACVADAGLPAEITPHWMRHTCATWLMEADVKPWEAAAYTGMTTATLEKCYGHHRPNHQRGARKALG